MYTNDFYVFDRQEFKALNILVHTLYIYVLNFVPKQIVGMSQKFKLMVPSSLTFLCWSLTINCYKLTDFTSAPMSPCTLLLTLVGTECIQHGTGSTYNNTHYRRTTDQCMAAVVAATASTAPMRFGNTGRAG